MLPKTGLLESEMPRGVLLFAQLPLASDAGCVTCRLQLMRKGGLPSIQLAELDVIPNIVLPGHDLGPRRGADRIGETVGKAEAL